MSLRRKDHLRRVCLGRLPGRVHMRQPQALKQGNRRHRDRHYASIPRWRHIYHSGGSTMPTLPPYRLHRLQEIVSNPNGGALPHLQWISQSPIRRVFRKDTLSLMLGGLNHERILVQITCRSAPTSGIGSLEIPLRCIHQWTLQRTPSLLIWQPQMVFV